MTLILALTWVFGRMWWTAHRQRKALKAAEESTRYADMMREAREVAFPQHAVVDDRPGRTKVNRAAAQLLIGNRVATSNFAYTKGGAEMARRRTVHESEVLASKTPVSRPDFAQEPFLASLNDPTPFQIFDNQAVSDMREMEAAQPPAPDFGPGGGDFGGAGSSGSFDPGPQ